MPENLHFLSPEWLWALLPIAGLLWLLRADAAGGNPWQKVVDARLLPYLMLTPDAGPRRGPLLLLAIGWLIAVLALANPAWERLPVPAYRGDLARVVVLDLSRSMLTPDLAPSRLERARFKVADLLQRSGDGQVALVAFAGDAFVVAPLSDDSVTLASLLQSLSPELMPTVGSRPDRGLAVAAQLLVQAGAQHGEVLLVTDDGGDQRAIDAAAALNDAGHSVSVLGVGTPEGAPLPGRRGGVQRDADGRVVVPTLDRDALAAVATAGGGRLALLSADDSDLDHLLPARTAALDMQLRESDMETDSWQGVGPWIALALLPLGLLGFRRGWLLLFAIALVPGLMITPGPVMAFGWDDLWQRSDQQSAAAATSGDYAAAAELADDPTRRGSARYRQGDYRAAAESFAAGEDADDYYNRGNALARMGELEQAIEAYDQALGTAPSMPDAVHNRALVEQALKQQQAPEKPEGQGQEDQQQQNGGDGEGKSDQQQGGQDSTDDGQQQDGEGQSGEGRQQQGEKDGSQQAGAGANEGAGEGEGEGEGEQGQAGQQPGANSDNGKGSGKEDESRTAEAAQPDDDDSTGGQRGELGDEPSQDESGLGDNAESGQPDSDPQRTAAGQDAKDGDDAGQREGGATDDGEIEANPMDEEQRLAMENWLRRIPDDAGGLLRRKFLYQYRQRGGAQSAGTGDPW